MKRVTAFLVMLLIAFIVAIPSNVLAIGFTFSPEKQYSTPSPDRSFVRAFLSTDTKSVDVFLRGNYYLTVNEIPQRELLPGIYRLKYTKFGVEIRDFLGNMLSSGGNFSLNSYSENGNFLLHNTMYKQKLNYSGDLYCYNKLDKKDGLFLVNKSYIDDYLRGVVPYEIGEGSEDAALMAQAVIARNYSMNSVRRGSVFDVYDGTQSQVYRGIPGDKPRSDMAVRQTAGIVMLFLGKRVETFYSASNGGQIEIPENRWGTRASKPYEIVKDDPYDLAYIRRGETDNNNYIESATIAKNPTRISGSLKKLVEVALLPELSRNIPDASISNIKLSNIDIQVTAFNHPEPCRHFETLAVTFYGESSQQPFTITKEINYKDFYVAATPSYGFFKNSKLSFYWLFEDEKNYTISHVRFGHGVGMSQLGAREMALQGFGFAEILKFYYDGITVETSNEISPKTAVELPALYPNGVPFSLIPEQPIVGTKIRVIPEDSEKLLVPDKSKYLSVTTSDPSIAQVIGNELHFVAPGVVYINLISSNSENTLIKRRQIQVIRPATAIKLNKNKTELTVGQREKVFAKILPTDATNKRAFFISDDPTIATVDYKGIITAVSPGEVNIIARSIDGWFPTICKVSVLPK